MRYLITKRQSEYAHLREEVGFEFCGFGGLVKDIKLANRIQFDTETSYIDTDKHKELTGKQHEIRELYVIQFGCNKNEYVIDYNSFTEPENAVLRKVLQTKKPVIIHNAAFDYTVVKAKLQVELQNMHDTYLMSRVLNMGTDFEPGYHSLNGCLNRFFDLQLDKTEQKSFAGEVMTASQLDYAFKDVEYLEDLYDELKVLLDARKLYKVYDEIERKLIAPLCNMGLSPMRFDTEHWKTVGGHLKEEKAASIEKLNAQVFKDPKLVEYLKDPADGEPLIAPKDTPNFKWGSPKFKKETIPLLVPDIDYMQISTLVKVDQYVKKQNPSPDELRVLKALKDRDFDYLENELLTKHRDKLVELGYLTPEGAFSINWGSPQQKLKVFNFYYPELKSTNQKIIKNLSNPLISIYRNFSGVNKSVSTYGDNFVRNYVHNGKIAPTGLRQVLNTGRMAYGILLQLPGKDIFRNAFLPPFEDWVFVDSDYSSAEICIMAKASGEEGLLQAIKDGRDLHSYSASIVFGQEWLDAAESDCEWMKTGHVCNCPKHKAMRKKSKAITFGLCYGISAVGLADQLEISKSEAKELMDKYFAGFPKLDEFLKKAEQSGKDDLSFTCMGPYYRRAFFPQPLTKAEESSIGRRCKNLTFQEGNATITKIAIIKMHEAIKKLDYPVMLHLPIHDELLSSCPRKNALDWIKVKERCMIEAGEMLLGKGILGVDTDVFLKWSKGSESSIKDELYEEFS